MAASPPAPLHGMERGESGTAAPAFCWERIAERGGTIANAQGKALWRLTEMTERARTEGVGWFVRTVRRWMLLVAPYTLHETVTQSTLRDEQGAWECAVLPDTAEPPMP